jgi:hypothetical protein
VAVRAIAVCVIWLLGAAALAAPASAQDPAAPDADPTVPVRKLYQAMRKARDETEAAIGDAKRYDELKKKSDPLWTKFVTEFAKLDWNLWDLAYDADLVAAGVSSDATKAFHAEDWARALKGWDFLAERLPDHRMTRLGQSRTLPEIYAACGQFDLGIEKTRAAANKLPPADAAFALIGLGDLLAAKGEFDAARTAYGDAEATFAKRAPGDDLARASMEIDLSTRKIVGEPLPDLSGVEWVGKPVAPVNAPGRPAVIVVFQARAYPLNGDMFRLAGSLASGAATKGLSVVGLTSYEGLTPLTMVSETVEVKMPRNPDDREGEATKVSRDSFRKYVETFRQRMRTTIPVAIGGKKTVSSVSTSEAFAAIVVVDASQRVVHVAAPYEWRGVRGIATALAGRSAAAGGK